MGADNAADIIRQKVAKIYAETEPAAGHELAEAETAARPSKHQQFMQALGSSGKSLAEIQTAWHNYYLGLSDAEKHEVWQEFYASNRTASQPPPAKPAAVHQAEKQVEQKQQVAALPKAKEHRTKPRVNRKLSDVVRDKVTAGGKLQPKHHLQSLLFGVGMGLIVVVIFLFGFFNEVFLAPFIQPSRHDASTPLIISSNGVAPTSDPEVIIPKINVEIPVNYNETSTDEATIENDLKGGVVHYPTTSLPGQNGNAAFFGHSSNNIFNPGKYKFAFVLLHELVPGDTFYLTKDNKVYVYKVFSKTIVDPSDVGVLNPVPGHNATATLITCDPPGTSLHRLVVVGDQISPDPSGNTAATPNSTTTLDTAQLPADGPTLWGRWWGTSYGKTVTITIITALIIWGARTLNRKVIPISQPA